MSYMSVSFTHKNTDIFLREKLSFSNEVKKREILRLIGSNSAIKECFVLSTCNRVEIFAFVDNSPAIRIMLDFATDSIATLEVGSCFKHASRIESDIISQILCNSKTRQSICL